MVEIILYLLVPIAAVLFIISLFIEIKNTGDDMPYIKQEDRERFDELVTELSDKIHNEGDLNYVITSLLHRQVDAMGECYKTYNALQGVMDCAGKEFYRRKVAPYEDKKIEENGDV